MAHYIGKLCLFFVFLMQVDYLHGFPNRGNLTLIESALSDGALCLDGSPPGYYFSEGIGDGAKNWLIILEGGGWCATYDECRLRGYSSFGSTKKRDRSIYFGWLKSGNASVNPDFYDWNRVSITYCDGASYLGDVDFIDKTPKIWIRGSRIFKAAIDELLAKGLRNASNVLLGGSSAGGLAAILHCDGISGLLAPDVKRVKCFSDSGFFIHGKKLIGSKEFESYFAAIAEYHNMTEFLPETCTSRKNSPGLCLFPEYVIVNMKTPVFLLESEFDQFQLRFRYDQYDPNFSECTFNLSMCTKYQLRVMTDYRNEMIKTLRRVSRKCPSLGMFVHSCIRHGHLYENAGWHLSMKLANKTIQEAVGDWYFDRSLYRYIDTRHAVPLTLECNKIPEKIR